MWLLMANAAASFSASLNDFGKSELSFHSIVAPFVMLKRFYTRIDQRSLTIVSYPLTRS
jgi:hypothetical protein